MKLLQRAWLAGLALLVASALPIHAQDRGRGAPRQLEKEEEASRDRAAREEQERNSNRDRNEEKRRDDDKRDRRDTPEWRRPPEPEHHDDNDRNRGPYYPNGGPYNGPTNDGNYPPYGGPSYNNRVVAEAVIDHQDPNRVNASLGAVGDPFRALTVRFREDSYDIVRQRSQQGNGHGNGHGNGNGNGNYRQTATVEVDLSRYTQWMDGRREWFLRIDDNSRQGGRLLSFVIRTDRGTYSVRNVPAYFGPNRRLEARVTPIANGTYGSGGGYPYPTPYPDGGGYPYPSPQGDGYPGPSYQNEIVRSMPQQGYVGQRVTLQYQVRANYGNVGRVEITEVLPPEGWQVVRAQPQPRYIDQRSNRVVWDIAGPRSGQTIILELIVPRIDGWQRFKGYYRFDGGQQLSIGGQTDIYVGNNYSGYPYGSGYNQPSYSAPGLAEVLGNILGVPNGINGQ